MGFFSSSKAKENSETLDAFAPTAVPDVKEDVVVPCNPTIKFLVWDGLYSEAGSLNSNFAQGDAPVEESDDKGPSLEIDLIDEGFAPLVENSVVKLSLANIAKIDVLTLRVCDRTGKLVYEERLDSGQLLNLPDSSPAARNANAPLERDQQEHEPDSTFANPLGSPYRVEVSILSKGGEVPPTRPAAAAETCVLYDSIQLAPLEWDWLYQAASHREDLDHPAGESAAVRRMWVQYKLNAAGYWAGPVNGEETPELGKAILRFRTAHPKLSGWEVGPFYKQGVGEMEPDDALPQRSKTMDEALVLALQEPLPQGVRRAALEEPAAVADGAKASRLFIDNHRFWVSVRSEFEASDEGKAETSKFKHEQEWINRPYLPLTVRTSIKDRHGEAVFVPRAVGEVPVLWSWTDTKEADLPEGLAAKLASYTDDQPSCVQAFVAKAQDFHGAGAAGYHNAHKDVGGLITRVQAENAVAAFAPCDPQGNLEYLEGAEGVTVAAATTKPEGARLDLRGLSSVYLSPSTLGGDSYRVSVRLDFRGHDNAAWLSDRHKDLQSVETGTFAVWRRVRLAAFVKWPPREGVDLAGELSKVRAEFASCFLELDTTDVREFESIKQVLTEDEFKALAGNKEEWRALSEEALYPRDPEYYAADFPLEKLVNALVRVAFFNGWLGTTVKSGKLMSAGALKNLNTAIRIARVWAGSGHAAVRSAGEHYTAELERVLTAPVHPAVDWTYRIQTGDDLQLALWESDVVTTPELAEALCLVGPLRDEIGDYLDGADPPVGVQSITRYYPWLSKALGSYAEAGLSQEYIRLLKLALVGSRSAGGFDSALHPSVRKFLFGVRARMLAERLGGWADLAKAAMCTTVDLKVRRILADPNDGELRATDGAVVLDSLVHRPVQIRGEDVKTEGIGYGGINGVCWIDQGLRSKMYSLLAHELAHCMFLQHGLNAPSTRRADHDERDDNCVMSYPNLLTKATFDAQVAKDHWIPKSAVMSAKPHYAHDVFTPHFCGKCNLKLRGWNLRSERMPDSTDSDPPPDPPEHAVEVAVIRGTVKDEQPSDAARLDRVGISFYPSAACGGSVAELEEFPSSFGFNEVASLDPNVFRVEVRDENTDADVVKVTLEALKPVYVADEASEWVNFPAGERARRALVEVECRALEDDKSRYRSRYLRLVLDESDRDALGGAKQGLLVTDLDEEPAVEILDQRVKVTYDPTPSGVLHDGIPKPSVNAKRKTLSVGAENRRRIRLFFHLVGFVGTDEIRGHVQRRTRKWVRRCYAQVGMAPKSLGFATHKKPSDDMLTILSRGGGVPTHRVRATAGGSHVTLTLKAGDEDAVTHTIALPGDLLPLQIGEAIQGGLEDGFVAELHTVPAASDEFGHPPSCDLTFSHGAGVVSILDATHDDAALQEWALHVPRLADDFSNLDNDDVYHGGSPMQRKILRCGTTADDRIDVFVVPDFQLPGRAYPAYLDITPARALEFIKTEIGNLDPERVHVSGVEVSQENVDRHLPRGALRRAVIIAEKRGKGKGDVVLGAGDDNPYVLSHEIAHVLADTGHTRVEGDLMHGTGSKTSTAEANKRIYAAPLTVSSPDLISNVIPPKLEQTRSDQDMQADMRSRGGADLTEPW
jgi:hypothetical protein